MRAGDPSAGAGEAGTLQVLTRRGFLPEWFTNQRCSRFIIPVRNVLLLASTCYAVGLGAETATFTYDELGRLRTGQFSDGRSVDYQYDPAGNRTAMTSGNPMQLSIGAPAPAVEGQSLSFPVTRTITAPGAQDVTVNCVPLDGTAQSGGSAPFDDYVNASQQLTFFASDPPVTTKNCDVVTKTDSYYEGTQTVAMNLQNASAGAMIVTGSANGSITDPGSTSPPVFSISGASAAEGSNITFTIQKSGVTELSHSVSYATANGSATTADNDYDAITATAITFTSAQTSKAVSVSTNEDGKYENAETLAVNLSAPTNGATIGTVSATGTINNNDAAPQIVIDNPPAMNEGGTIVFTVTNAGNTSTALSHSISWATANGTATAGSDYTSASGTKSFSDGVTTRTISIVTLTDGANEGGNQNFYVNLSTNANSNGASITDNQGVGTIADLDSPPSVPTNLHKSGAPNSPNYTILWDASTGPIHHYHLLESGSTTYTINDPATSKAFTNKPTGTYTYKVRGCNAANQCSAYTSQIMVIVCNGPCP